MENSVEQITATPVGDMKTPYLAQDAHITAELVRSLEDAAKSKKKAGFTVKKARFDVDNSPDGIRVDSWRMQDWDYKRRDLPVYARGLFTTRTRNNVPEIAVRGYDKFFNVGEVHETQWENVRARTRGPYELTLKENGCIIFVAGLEDDTLLVCSKHSTGDRGDAEVSHAKAGEVHLLAQLERLGKTSQDLARELRKRNVTAVAELCDDAFEEHILAYGPEKAGLYLHGININVPEFATYPSSLVQKFADDWGFVKTGLIVMDDIDKVKEFLEDVAETGAHGGRDIEGFVIRCTMSPKPESMPFRDWFFKYKFEEPYLMYRQWRECTKAMIAGKQPKFKKHQAITQEYLLYARKRLAAEPKLAKLYNQNHGIIKLREEFLAYKNLKGSDAAAFEELHGGGGGKTEVTGDVILVPIATIGCGKTTIALALAHLLDFGHFQNDNLTGPKRPPRFTKLVLQQLQDHVAVTADRNNSGKHERKQIISDVKMQKAAARLVALNFVHDDLEEVRRVTRERVFERGDNHQTIQAASDQRKVIEIMENFINRFEPCDLSRAPDDGFDAVIDLDASADSRANLETVVTELHRLYPNLVKAVPTPEEMDAAIQAALDEYRPELRHTIPDRSGGRGRAAAGPSGAQNGPSQQQRNEKKKGLEYMSVDVPAKDLRAVLDKAFAAVKPEDARFYKQLTQTRRVQPRFHVTLMHRASAKEHPALWARYAQETEAAGSAGGGGELGECDVQLERVVFDDRIMAVVVRLIGGEGKWECVNRVAHVTIGTRDDNIKPKESNDVLARWLDEGPTEANHVVEVALESRPTLKGTVKGVLSR